jgi:hypothetical protein
LCYQSFKIGQLASRLGQFCETCGKLILNFTQPHAITYTIESMPKKIASYSSLAIHFLLARFKIIIIINHFQDTKLYYKYILQTHITNTYYKYILQIHFTNTYYKYILQIHILQIILQIHITNTFYKSVYIIQIHITNIYYKYILQIPITNTNYKYILKIYITNTYYKYILQIQIPNYRAC